MKKIAIFLVFLFSISITEIYASASDAQSDMKYSIQYEKLAGTETAEEFNSYKNELISYFNGQIKKERNLHALKKAILILMIKILLMDIKFGTIMIITPIRWLMNKWKKIYPIKLMNGILR